MSTDDTNWLHALGSGPRVRVRFDCDAHGIRLEPHHVGYVEADDGQDWAEILDTNTWANALAYRPAPVYVRVFVGPNTRPGRHIIRATVFCRPEALVEEQRFWNGTAVLEVHEAMLPSPRQWSFHLDLWQHLTCLSRHHRVAPWSDDHFRVIDAYFASLADLGQKAVTVVATEVPWAGQQCFRDRKYPSYLFEHAVVRVRRHPFSGTAEDAAGFAASQPYSVAASAPAAAVSVAATQAALQNPLPLSSIAMPGIAGAAAAPTAVASARTAHPFPPPSGPASFAGGAAATGDAATRKRPERPVTPGSPREGMDVEDSESARKSQRGAATPSDSSSPRPQRSAAAPVQRPSRLEFDFSVLDRLLQLASKHGMDREIEVFGLLSVWHDSEFGFGSVLRDGPDTFIRVPCIDAVTGCAGYLSTVEELRAFVDALHTHFASIGVLERVRVCADEPSDLAAFKERLAFLRSCAPGFRYKVAINHFEFMEDAPDDVIDCVPYLPLACRDPKLTTALHQKVRAKGGRMLWYVCCVPDFPNSFVTSPLVELQLFGWLTNFLKLDGALRWNYCLWPDDPWRKVSWRAPMWKAGDMFFVLPGPTGKPVLTLRYEALRRAVQDYELLQLAHRTLSTAEVEGVMKSVYEAIFRSPHISNFQFVSAPGVRAQELYSLNPYDFEAARTTILEALRLRAPLLAASASSAASHIAVVGMSQPLQPRPTVGASASAAHTSMAPLSSAASAASSAVTAIAAAYVPEGVSQAVPPTANVSEPAPTSQPVQHATASGGHGGSGAV